MHFCWKDRSSGEVVDDLIIFPDDVNFKHIPPARISAARCDRIYVLKFKASTRKFFFWMQVRVVFVTLRSLPCLMIEKQDTGDVISISILL